MDKYILEPLAAGIIRLSSSPAGLTILMGPAKGEVVTDWPPPMTRRDLQRFLGFAFYCSIIRDYSSVADPLTSLTFFKNPFQWSNQAKEAFSKLKTLFTSLEYLKSAKEPKNSRQARWSLFFSRLGNKNTKPDALSCQFIQVTDDSPVATILPSHYLMGAAFLNIETLVKQTLNQDPGPPDALVHQMLLGMLFVPPAVRSQVLEWGHNSQLACHPGGARTLALIWQRFWWSPIREDTLRFVSACDVCARNKTSNKPPDCLQTLVPYCIRLHHRIPKMGKRATPDHRRPFF